MKVYIMKNIQIACLNIENIPRIGEQVGVVSNKNDPFGHAEVIKGEVCCVNWICTHDKVLGVEVYLK